MAQRSLVRSMGWGVSWRNCQQHGVCAAGRGQVQVLRKIAVVSAVAGTVLPVPLFDWNNVLGGSLRLQVPRVLEV